MTGLFVAGTGPVPYRARPCGRCPWRKDTPPGEFTAARYEVLRSTSPQHEHDEPGWDAPLFACHKTSAGREATCAGWLATVAYRHLGVRLALAQKRIPHRVLTPRAQWPELFATYPEMEAAQARRPAQDQHDQHGPIDQGEMR